jgi:alginate O-acetyltransferase complex protein AlgI
LPWLDLVSVFEFATAMVMTKRYLVLDAGGSERLPVWLAGIGPVLLLGQLLMRRWYFAAQVCGLSLNRFALALSLPPLGYRPFIYFQF